jgi:hypothetical protein
MIHPECDQPLDQSCPDTQGAVYPSLHFRFEHVPIDWDEERKTSDRRSQIASLKLSLAMPLLDYFGCRQEIFPIQQRNVGIIKLI